MKKAILIVGLLFVFSACNKKDKKADSPETSTKPASFVPIPTPRPEVPAKEAKTPGSISILLENFCGSVLSPLIYCSNLCQDPTNRNSFLTVGYDQLSPLNEMDNEQTPFTSPVSVEHLQIEACVESCQAEIYKRPAC